MNLKRVLIVDDSEIDREILKNILHSDFDIVEADNGYSGVEMLISGRPRIDVVLLDVSMPVIDGFNVLQLMIDNKVNNIPVILITAEATKANVQKAAAYNVSEFISKPFDPEVILERVRGICNIPTPVSKEAAVSSNVLTEDDIMQTETYISKLKDIYKEYLNSHGGSRKEYSRVAALMKTLLTEYAASTRKFDLDSAHIDIISKAVYFYDIGQILIPDDVLVNKNDREVYESHTTAGADIIHLNTSPACRFFVNVCSDMCTHHHERYDGNGYPHRLRGNENTVYAQLCTIAIRFDQMFMRRPEISEAQFDFVINEMIVDSGMFSYDLISLLKKCRSGIVAQYKKSNLKGTVNNSNNKEILNIHRMGIQ